MTEDEISAQIVIVIPCLNEESHIAPVLDTIAAEAEALDAIVIVMDGGSRDRTTEIVEGIAARNARVRLENNGQRTQSAAVNRAAAMAAGSLFLLRIDAHCAYPPDYCRTLVAEAEASGASSIVVSLLTEGTACFQRAVAAAQNTRLGNGGSPHRRAGKGAFVPHGHHALFRTRDFLALGGYDESFTHNEDAEFDHRLTSAEHRIWLTGATTVTYFPRSTPLGLFRQYRNYGRGRARTFRKHGIKPSLRQLIPAAIAPIVVLAALSPLSVLLALPAIGWCLLCLTYGMMIGWAKRDACASLSGVAAMIMHLAWSIGFWEGRIKGDRQGPNE
jgi:succinoglycan biosynthesis protein ExoA